MINDNNDDVNYTVKTQETLIAELLYALGN